MKRSDREYPPSAVIGVRGLDFQVWLKDGRISHLELPEAPAAACRETGVDVRIDIKAGIDNAGEEMLRELGAFLRDSMVGVMPRSVPALYLEGCSEFSSKVFEVVKAIPCGATRSYGWVARRAGRPGAARAVGNVLSANPVPLLVPCHRVVRSDGSTGGWSGRPGWKEFLLETEQASRGKVPRGTVEVGG